MQTDMHFKYYPSFYNFIMNITYKYNDMVFAKCQNYPYWPGKIIGTFTNSSSCKVLFYGQKSEATIENNFIIPFNEESYKRFSQDNIAKTNRALKFSLSVAMKRFNKRKKGEASSGEEEDFYQDEPKKEDNHKKIKPTFSIQTSNLVKTSDPHIQLGNLLNLLSEEASNMSSKDGIRKFKPEHETRMKELLESNSLLLPVLIDNRIIDKFIVVLKQLDLWGLNQFPELNQLHKLVRKRYEEYRSIILSPQFASMPLREAKRQHILQKVIKNKAVL